MPKHSRTFWLPRRGHDSAEYEDAFAADEAARRFAVADGASEGCFTGLWAKLLVEDFVAGNGQEAGAWPADLPALQERWFAEVHTRELPWYAEQGVLQGAFATFMGLVLQDSPRPSRKGATTAACAWQAVAVGDTCLLHTRGDALLRAFPIAGAGEFDNFPRLVGSCMTVNNVRARESLWLDGRGQSGDRLWMMTDALAQWCLTEHEAGDNPWAELECLILPSRIGRARQGGRREATESPDENGKLLPPSGRGLGGQDAFDSLIERLRESGDLRNDDVTLLAIEL